jgi:DegV family protein with EDD domain
MTKTVIITDSDASLPETTLQKYGILCAPIGINFGNDTYISGETIDDVMVFKIIDEKQQIPSTSAPNPQAYIDLYTDAFQQGADTIICITVSSQVSSTYESAVKAREAFQGRDIHVIDSLNLAIGQGFMVLAAAEAAARGASVDEIKAAVKHAGENIHTFATLPTLKYLYLGGRVSRLQASLADTFEIRPTLTVKEGKLVILEKNRTMKRGLDQMIKHVHKIARAKTLERMAILHVNDPSGAEKLKVTIQETMVCPEVIEIVALSPGLSVHTGAGLLGVVVQTGVKE